jgi:O-antigen ligase
LRSTPNSAAEPSAIEAAPVAGWRWAPAWVLAYVALWPAPGYAEGVLVLGALVAIAKLLLQRFRGGTRLLSHQAWALTGVLFAAYWLPELFSTFDAVNRAHSLAQTVSDLRYLPFLWLAASAVASDAGRRTTFTGLAAIMAIWTIDALAQEALGASPLFSLVDIAKHAISDHGMCTAAEVQRLDRLSGILGPCNLKLGLVLASLSPFVLDAAHRRWKPAGWLVAAFAVGIVILLAGARASWITYALVLALSGWRALGVRRLVVVFALGAVLAGGLFAFSPQVRERFERTSAALTADREGVDVALSGRTRIWGAAWCMVRTHPVNGVGARDFRDAFPACDPAPGEIAAWGEGPAFHAHQWVLEVLSETGVLGLLLWIAGIAMAWRAWRYASPAARDRARPPMIALFATLFPFNTHLAFYSTFWGGLALLLAALYAGSLLANESPPAQSA